MFRTDRRQFLGGLAAAVAKASTSAASVPERVIDTHIHLYDPSRPQGVPWPSKDNALLYRTTLPADFRAAAKGLGVTGAVVIESNAWLEDNQWVLDLAKDDPLIVGFVGHLEPGDAAFAQNLARFSKNRLFRGIRITGRLIAARMPQPGFQADLKRLADQDLQIDVIGDNSMFGDVLKIADREPRLRIVIDHLPFDPATPEDTLSELGRRPQVYAKVSNVLRRVGETTPVELSFYRESLDRLWETFGGNRLIYGSNWPVSNRFAPYPAVLKVVREYFTGKGPDAADRYFRTNSKAAYKWVDR
jgi:L-fuconolactonase